MRASAAVVVSGAAVTIVVTAPGVGALSPVVVVAIVVAPAVVVARAAAVAVASARTSVAVTLPVRAGAAIVTGVPWAPAVLPAVAPVAEVPEVVNVRVRTPKASLDDELLGRIVALERAVDVVSPAQRRCRAEGQARGFDVNVGVPVR